MFRRDLKALRRAANVRAASVRPAFEARRARSKGPFRSTVFAVLTTFALSSGLAAATETPECARHQAQQRGCIAYSFPSLDATIKAFGDLGFSGAAVGMLRMMRGGKRLIQLTVTAGAPVGNYNIFTQAGSPADAVDVLLTINSGAYCFASLTTAAALLTGSGWAANSTITVVNNGKIYGCGGNGGAGGNGTAGGPNNGTAGSAGGPAINLSWPITIDNTNGYIYGGGGGGGGGADHQLSVYAAGGGGGGGGDGGPGSGYGAGGAPGLYGVDGSYGGNGDAVAGSGGVGGAGGNDSSIAIGGTGGNGGQWGGVGAAGGSTSTNTGGAAGAAGKAVALNGQPTPTWLGGNNSTQVKGAVS